MDHDSDFFKAIFIGLIAMQYHPRNSVSPDADTEVISRCLDVANKAYLSFYHFVNDSEGY